MIARAERTVLPGSVEGSPQKALLEVERRADLEIRSAEGFGPDLVVEGEQARDGRRAEHHVAVGFVWQFVRKENPAESKIRSLIYLEQFAFFHHKLVPSICKLTPRFLST